MTTATIAQNDVSSKPDESPIELASPVRYLPEPSEYTASCFKFEKLADLKLRNSDTIILGGYGCLIKIRNGSLVVEYQRAYTNNKVLKLDRGVHKIKQIIVSGHGGYITFDALEWCKDQKVTVSMMNWKGEVLQVLTPKQSRNAKLSYLQWRANESELGLAISVELIRQKTLAQIATLEKLGKVEAVKTLEDSIRMLHTVSTIEKLRTVEGRLAAAYFACFADMPIKWVQAAMKVVPEHWLIVSPRNSPLSNDGSGRHATNPYHAALNFAYALLEAQILQAIYIAGLDETVGFLHAYREGKHTLVFDLMEPFRATVDYLILQFFQKRKFKKGDFVQEFTGEARMNEELKRYILASCRVSSIEIDRLIRWLRSTLES